MLIQKLECVLDDKIEIDFELRCEMKKFLLKIDDKVFVFFKPF